MIRKGDSLLPEGWETGHSAMTMSCALVRVGLCPSVFVRESAVLFIAIRFYWAGFCAAVSFRRL